MKRFHTQIAFLLITAVISLGLSQAVLAKGPRNKVTVESATPAEATQGIEETVLVNGAGFDQGSSVQYLVTGTTDGSQVEVLSVEYVSSTQLKTKIRPKDAAIVTDYDIEVRTSSGRKGKGTTLFRVKSRDGDPCATSMETDPAIVYLTPSVKTGPRKDYVYTTDLKVTTSDGCKTTMLIEHAEQWLPATRKNEGKNRFIENVSRLRLTTSQNRGIVSWIDAYKEPWVLEYMEIFYDEQGDISINPVLGSYVSSIGYLITDQEILIQENGDLLAAVIEKEDNQATRRITVVNLSNPAEPEQVIESGTCFYLGPDGLCYSPRYGYLHWDPTGDVFYVEYQHAPETGFYTDYIFRVSSDLAGGWLPPEPLMTNVGTDPFQRELDLTGVSLDGLVGFELLNPDYSGNASPHLRGILDPGNCVPANPCNGNDAMYLMEGASGPWTAEDTMLFRDDGNILEYLNPYVSQESRTIVVGAGEFDSDM